MLHSYVKISLHLVWATKNREPFLVQEVRPQLHHHIKTNAGEKRIEIDTLSIQTDHVHMLINLRSDQQVDDVVKLIKGESSHWINAENLIKPKFSWQRGYGAFSISHSQLDVVRAYIKNQDEHHQKRTYRDEVIDQLHSLGFDVNQVSIEG